MASEECESDPGWVYLRQPTDVLIKEQAARRFDNSTHVWISDPIEGFIVAETISKVDEQVVVKKPDGSEATVKRSDAQEINPAKFEKTEDMANLTFLNEASVLHNLRQRYQSMMIYTYSGLFLVVINPYKMLPIYSESVASMYVNKRRNEMPPHLFAVSDLAYRNMITDKENQSMLITGESGAGKTENTKKVISYFARIGATPKEPKTSKNVHFADQIERSLEDQVVQANPAIEAFGNGATVRNYNSSRYGKFVRIHFNTAGRLVGGDIEHYLLEKSRVIKQAPGERSFHIFYQLMSNSKLRHQFLLSSNIRDYRFVSQAEITVPGMDDTEEWKITDNAFDVMGFTASEKNDLYKTCAAIMHMGQMEFKQKPREEQAEVDNMAAPQNVCSVLGVDAEKFIAALLKPKVKVGGEWVSKGQTLQQVEWSVGSLSMAIYARMFICNRTLSTSLADSANYIGVLDIAGFEIFDRNSFEQLWINFVNEKLQQFFNHHMFVLEQEEYQREGIKWEFIDFGLDLESCINLIEKPMGIVSMLDEECIVPKATDMTYVDKLNTQHLGKHPNYQRPKPPKGKQAPSHFAIIHYAGTVNYNADSWLDKNKDPLNDSAVAVLKTADKSSLIYEIWADFQTAVDREEEETRGRTAERKKGKAASFLTVSMMYRESLGSLMTMLHSTQPHFIRCIVPNEKKQSGVIDAALVLNQLTCNGVLEGIRICRKGFPNRMLFNDFRYRYAILAASEASDKDIAQAVKKVLDKLVDAKKLQVEEYRIGNTKVFFKSGVLARLEELRDAALTASVALLQRQCRWHLAQRDYYRRAYETEFVIIIQENVRQWTSLRNWSWFRLYTRLKPLMEGLKKNEQVEELEKKLKETEDAHRQQAEARRKLEGELAERNREMHSLKDAFEKEKLANAERQRQMDALNNLLNDEKSRSEKLQRTLEESKRDADAKLSALQNQLLQEKKMLESAMTAQAAQIEGQQLAMRKQKEDFARLLQQKKAQELDMQDFIQQTESKLARAEEQVKRLSEELEQSQERLNYEKRQKEEIIKERKKLAASCNQLQDELEKMKRDRENIDDECRKMEATIGQLKSRADEDATLISKMQASMRNLIARIEQLEDELENEQKSRMRAEKLRTDTQNELGEVQEQISELKAQLSAQRNVNSAHQHSVSELQRKLQRQASTQPNIGDLCTMQWMTLNNLRNLSRQAQFLENEANRVLDFRRSTQSNGLKRSESTREFYTSPRENGY